MYQSSELSDLWSTVATEANEIHINDPNLARMRLIVHTLLCGDPNQTEHPFTMFGVADDLIGNVARLKQKVRVIIAGFPELQPLATLIFDTTSSASYTKLLHALSKYEEFANQS